MLIKPYNSIFTNTLDAYEQTYEGEVIDNNDPEKLKRIKVMIPIWDMYTDDELQWVAPSSNIGTSANVDSHNIPEVGSKVTIFFNNKDSQDPRYTGAGVTESTKCNIFDEDYPNTYGEKDSIGNFTMHNKNTGISVFHHNSGSEVQMDPDGSFIVQSGKTGAYIACDSDGQIRVSAPNVSILADEEINLAATRITIGCENTNIVQLDAKMIEVNATDSLTLSASYSKILGAQCSLETQEVRIVKTLTVESADSYTLVDPLGKSVLAFAGGMLLTKKSLT